MKRRKKIDKYIYMIFAFVLLVLIFNNQIDKVLYKIKEPFYPLKNRVYTFTEKIKGKMKDYRYIKEAGDENVNLKNELFSAKIKLLEMENILDENRRLREDLNLDSYKEYSVKVAKISFRDPFSIYENFVIDKGLVDGVVKDAVVLNKGEVIGKVLHVYKEYSEVEMITKKGIYISVTINDDRSLGILKGRDSKIMKLENIIIDADISLGDLIYTSGISDIYPKGIVIGKVVKVEDGKDKLFKIIDVESNINLLDIHEVVLINREVK